MKKLLLITSSLLIPMIAHAAESTCTAAPTCEELGYKQTVTTCTTLGLKYVKCPFGSTVACVSNLPETKSDGSIDVAAACKEAGYPYTAAQCGKAGIDSKGTGNLRQIGIPCPYSKTYYYCRYPNQNAVSGGYLCSDGTASSTADGCGGKTYVIGVVLSTPSYVRRGVVALTKYAFYGHGDKFNDFCKNTYAAGNNFIQGISGTPRPPNTTTETKLMVTFFTKIKEELSRNYSSGVSFPLWSAECWEDSVGTNNNYRCHTITSSGTEGNAPISTSDHYGVCVADF